MQDRRLTEEQIRCRAYELYLTHGRPHGHDRDDWLQAEYELTQLPASRIAEPQATKSKLGRATKQFLAGLVAVTMLLGA